MIMTKTTFPAEWENQQGILLLFHNGRDWPENTKDSMGIY
jgi:agmatine/peptidylarginine deiminase